MNLITIEQTLKDKGCYIVCLSHWHAAKHALEFGNEFLEEYIGPQLSGESNKDYDKRFLTHIDKTKGLHFFWVEIGTEFHGDHEDSWGTNVFADSLSEAIQKLSVDFKEKFGIDLYGF